MFVTEVFIFIFLFGIAGIVLGLSCIRKQGWDVAKQSRKGYHLR